VWPGFWCGRGFGVAGVLVEAPRFSVVKKAPAEKGL
jgi:hypothetical protein